MGKSKSLHAAAPGYSCRAMETQLPDQPYEAPTVSDLQVTESII
jgi:hypothetical protein